MARTYSQRREAFGGQHEMDAVALKLIASVGVGEAYRIASEQVFKPARPVLDLARQEMVHTTRQLPLDLK